MLLHDDYRLLAAPPESRRVVKKSLTSPLKNRVWGSCGTPSGRMAKPALQPAAIASGSVTFSYESASGRTEWLSRDPVGESGGFNLMGFVDNNSIGSVDLFGLAIITGNESLEELLRWRSNAMKNSAPGFPYATKHLHHWFEASGTELTVPQEWLEKWKPVKEAEDRIKGYFKTKPDKALDGKSICQWAKEKLKNPPKEVEVPATNWVAGI